MKHKQTHKTRNRKRRFLLFISTLLLLCLFTFCNEKESHINDQNSFHNYLKNSKEFLISQSSTDHRPLWSYTINGYYSSSAMSADGKYIAIGTSGGTAETARSIYLLNSTGSLLWSYQTGGFMGGIILSDDGQYIAAASQDYKIYFFNRDNPLPIWNYSINNPIASIVMTNDSKYIVVGDTDGYLHLFNTTTQSLVWSYPLYSVVRSLGISNGEHYIVTADDWEHVFFFDVNNPTPLWNYSNTGIYHFAMTISDDGLYCATQADIMGTQKIFVFNKTGAMLWNKTAFVSYPGVKLSNDGNYLYYYGNDKIFFHELSNNETPLWSYELPWDANFINVMASQDFKLLAFGMSGSISQPPGPRICIFNTTDTSILWTSLTGDYGSSAHISNNGQHIAGIYHKSSSQSIVAYFHLTQEGPPPTETPPFGETLLLNSLIPNEIPLQHIIYIILSIGIVSISILLIIYHYYNKF